MLIEERELSADLVVDGLLEKRRFPLFLFVFW